MIKFLFPFLLTVQLYAQNEPGYVEKHFPFYTSMLRTSESATSPRALILKTENKFQASFDLDKLCFTAIWQGESISMNAMAPGSYSSKAWFKKAPEGEKNVPRILSNKLLTFSIKNKGQWKGLYLTNKGPVISYKLGDSEIQECLYSEEKESLCRQIKITKVNKELFLPLLKNSTAAIEKNVIAYGNRFIRVHSENSYSISKKEGIIGLRFTADKEIDLNLVYSSNKNSSFNSRDFPNINERPKSFWPESIQTELSRSIENAEFVLEEIALPISNKFKRKVRLSGIAFFDDNKVALSTFDGDIWIVKLRNFKWKRYASGFNEPQSLVIKNGLIYVFDRNGIIRLHDRDKNGEADFYENFCNLPIQTIESRDFAMDMVLHPDGSFILAKGGQRGQTVSPHAGSILKVSPDGKKLEVLATNLREPYLGIDPHKGGLFVSDQQGNWVPTTPVYLVNKGDNFGFKAGFQGKEAFEDIAKPLVWVPYTMNQSAAGIFKYKENQFFVLDYSKPGVGVLYYAQDNPEQVSYRPINLTFPFPLLKGAANPTDGLAYFTGFKIWGSKGEKISGFGRLVPKKIQLFKQAQHFKEGIYLEYKNDLSSEFLNPVNYKLSRWNIKRTYKYGSGHFKRDGSSGEEKVAMSSITLSKGKKAIFIAIPDMQKVDQMKIITPYEELALTIRELKSYSTVSQKFSKIDFSLPALVIKQKDKKASIKIGIEIAKKFGCITCHATKVNELGKPGPAWIKLFGSQRTLVDNRTVLADAQYLKESILEPAKKVVKEFQPLMPSYKGMISENQLDSLILYIRSLK